MILQSSRFTYNRKLINNNRINVRARKLNEPVGFRVTCSSLNNLGSGVAGKIKINTTRKKKKKKKTEELNSG